MKVIGISGASYCGSTIVARLLSSLPGVISPGEIHWLLDHKRSGDESYGISHLCYQCGPSCPVLPLALLDSVSEDNIYNLLRLSYGGIVDVLISNDKSMGQFVRYQRMPDFILFLTRDPVTHIVSLARSTGSEEKAAHAWRSFHVTESKNVSRSGIPFARMSLEVFLRDPPEAVTWLHKVTDGMIPKGVPVFPAVFHHVWGNTDAVTSVGLDKQRPGRRVPNEVPPTRLRALVLDGICAVENMSCEHLR